MHAIRKGKLEYQVLSGKTELGKRARGRQRLTFLGWWERSTGTKPLDIIKRLQKRQENDVVAAVSAWIVA